MKTIKSIEKGWGEGSTYYSTDEKLIGHPTFVNEILREVVTVGRGFYNDVTMDVYRGYIHPNKEPVFEIESNSSLTIVYNQS